METHNKLLKLLNEFKGGLGDIKTELINNANNGISKLDEGEQKDFLKDSLGKVASGELTANQFKEQFKKYQ
tara:strand:+ start:8717 stop:8929 length:213 start_codon:yes stop_codon:yes gene_type:complete